MADSQPLPPNGHLAIAESQRVIAGRGLEPNFIEGEFREVPPRRLRDHLRVIWKHRRLGAACFAGCVGAALLISLLVPKTYSAAAQIQVGRTSQIKLQLKGNVLDLDETERILNGTSSFLTTQVEALRSRDVAERAIRTFHLAENASFLESNQSGAALAAVPIPLPSFLHPRGLDRAEPVNAPYQPASNGPVDPKLIDRYMSYLTVGDVRGTDLIEVRITAPDPELAAILTAAHIQAYIASIKETQVSTDTAARDFLATQLEESRQRLERSEAALTTFANDHPDVAINQEDELVARQIKLMAMQVSDAEARRAKAQSKVDFLAKATREPLEHVLQGNEAIPKLRLMMLDIQSQEASLKQRLGPNHSQMRELRRQGTEIRLQLDNEIRQEVAAAKAKLRAAKLQEGELRGRMSALEKKAMLLRSIGGQYELLKSERDTAREQHESLLQQKTDTAVHSELATTNVRVIERPEVPRFAASPRKKMNLLIGALAGLALAIGAAFFRESLDSSVKSSEEAEGLLQLPTLAIIPSYGLVRPLVSRLRESLRQGETVSGILTSLRGNDAVNGNGVATRDEARGDLIVVQRPWSPVAETFRILRTALLFSSNGAPPQVILVTSASSGEGKTVTSLNLASTLADAGRRVLLIDVDLRHPRCHEVLGSPLGPGLSSYLTGDVDLDRVVREIPAPHIGFVSAGPPPANPAELVGSERLSTALGLLRKHFDVIVLDSPPVLPVTDAVLLAHLADAVVLVMDGSKSPGDLVRRARDQLVQVGANIVGVVINNAGPDWGSAYLYDYDRYHQAASTAGGAPAA
jgi:capsular exopolysaccharide synthesis family protein